jgi:hypothetical protein
MKDEVASSSADVYTLWLIVYIFLGGRGVKGGGGW